MISLQLTEILDHLRRGPLDSANELTLDLSISADQEAFWVGKRSIQRAGFVIRIAHGQHTWHLLRCKSIVSVCVHIHAHRKDGYFVAHLLLQCHQCRHLLHAGRTPRSPEIEQYRLAAELAQLNCLLAVVHGKIRSGPANLCRSGITAGAKSKHQRCY